MIKVRDGYGKLIGSNYNGNIAHVLLSNGGNLEYAVGSTASTLVLRNASGQIESSVASTVAPFVISSTKVNTNLNADLLDGFLATGLFQSLTSAADKNLYIKIGDTEKEVPLLYASYLGGVTKEGLFTELTNVNDSTNPNSIKVTIGDTTKYLKVGYADNAASASKVGKKLIIKANSGTTEGTNLYTFDGSADKTINFVAGSNITITPTANTLTIASSYVNTTYTLSGALTDSDKTYTVTLTPNSGNPTTAVIPSMTGATSSASGKAGLVPVPATGNRLQFLRGDGTWLTPTNTKNTAGSTNSTSKLFLIGATEQSANPQTYSNLAVFATAGTLNATAFVSGDGINDFTAGTVKLDVLNIPTSSGGATFGPGSNGQVLKSNGTTVYWASDSSSNSWRAIQVNGTQIAGTGTDTYALNFISGTGITVAGTSGSSSAANSITITNAGVRSTTINGNYLRVNTNGTNADLTIPYATTASLLSNTSVSDPSKAASGLYLKWYSLVSQASGYAGTNYGFPVSNNANGILWLGTHSGPYGWQMGFSSNGRIYARYISNNTFPTTANGGSWNKIAWVSDIPTKTSQLTNDSGFLTSRGYIGTTAVLASSASQSLTGIANITMSGSINTVLKATTSLGAALLNIAEVTADTNYVHLYVSSLNSAATTTRALVLQNGYGNVGIGTPTPSAKLHVVGLVNITANSGTLTIGCLNTSWTHYSTTGGTHWFNKAVEVNGNLTPHANNSFTLGTSSKRWSNVYSVFGNFTGDVISTISTSDAVKHAVTNTNGSVELLVHSNRGLYDRTNSKWIIYVPNGTSKVYVPTWANKGGSTTPVYFNASGEPVTCTAYSGLLTALSSSSSTNLSITVGGTTKSITNTYATNITLISCYNGTTNNDLWSTVKTGNSTYIGTANIYEVYNDGGPTTYGEVLDIVSAHTNHWLALLWFGSGKAGHLYYRNKDYNDATWGSWRTILDTGNYSSYLGYIGTTAVLKSSAAQALTGITNATLSGKLIFTTAAATASISFLNGELIDGYGNVLLGTNSASWNVFNSSRSSLITVLKNGNVGIGTTAPIHKLQVAGAGVFNNTGSTTYATDGITIGAGDATARYITCYGKTGLSYINIGYNAVANNSGELHFSYSSSGSTSNYVGLLLYGAANCVKIYPGYTQSIKYISAPNYISSVATGTLPYACTSTTLNTNLNADLLDGYHRSNLYATSEAWFGAVGLTKSITVTGDSAYWYPVVITCSADKQRPTFISVWKNLGSTTPAISGNHSNGTSSLWLQYEMRNPYWDGNGGYIKTWYKYQGYATLVAHARTNTNATGLLIVWLRGGTCQYNISCTNSFSVNIYYSSTNISGSSTYPDNVDKMSSVNNGGIYTSTYLGYGNISGNAATATTASNVVVNNSDANSTYRMVWHSGNTLYSTAGIYCNPSTDCLYAAHYYETSDIAFKTNIKPILNSDNIPVLKSFDWKSDGSHSYGLIALELEDMGYPELVSEGDGYKTVNYSAALSLIVGKLQVKIKELEKEIEILKNKN